VSDGPGPPEDVEAQLDRWAFDHDVAEAIRARRGTRQLVGLAHEERVFRDVLDDMARRGPPVEIATTSGRNHVGRVEFVGEDHIRLRTARGIGLIGLGAILQMSERPGLPSDFDPDLGSAAPTGQWTEAPVRLVHAVERLIGTEAVVRVAGAAGAAGGNETTGEIESVGGDFLVVLRPGGPRPERVYPRFEAVAEVWPLSG